MHLSLRFEPDSLRGSSGKVVVEATPEEADAKPVVWFYPVQVSKVWLMDCVGG